MNLLCPSCQKEITVPDSYAGQLMKCPLCASTFQAPALAPVGPPPAAPPTVVTLPAPPEVGEPPTRADTYRFAPEPPPPPRVESPPPSAATSPPPPRPSPRPAPAPPLPPPPGDYGHGFTIWVSPRVVPWIAPAALVVVFVLMYFPWVERLIDQTVQVQTGWRTAFGGLFTVLGLLQVLCFLLALLTAVASVVLPHVSVPLPNVVQQLRPWRSGIIAGLTFLACFFLAFELLNGFGLEQMTPEGPTSIPSFLTSLPAWHWFTVRRTSWLVLAVLANLTALIGALLELWLALRGNHPLPRVVVSW